jgi:hypothetical protein
MKLTREWQPGEDPPIVAVAIQFVEGGTTHVGMIYQQEDGTSVLKYIHLAFHCKFENTEIDESCIFLVPNLSVVDLEIIAMRCRSIVRNKPNIMYGFKYNCKCKFDNNGYLYPSNGNGLNCSTFVLAIFNSVRVKLVNEPTWIHRSDDTARFSQLFGILKAHIEERYGNNMSHITHVGKIASDIKSLRIRPEETAGACMADKYPATYTQCEPNGKIVLKELSDRQDSLK